MSDKLVRVAPGQPQAAGPDGPASDPSSQHVWTSGDLKTTSVREHLLDVARTSARAAVHYHLSSDHSEVLWAANAVGIALETSLKLTLANVDPVLISDPRSKPGTNLLLAGAPNFTLTSREIKTIGATDAALLVRQMHKGIAPPARCELVFEVRNSATHMGVVSRAELNAAVAAMVSVIEGLLKPMGCTSQEFWGALSTSVIPGMLSDQISKLQRKIEAKKLQARLVYQRLVTGVPAPQLGLLLSTLESAGEREIDGEETVRQQCPVCGRNAVLRRYIEEPDRPFGFGYGGEDPGSGERYAYLDEFQCFVCQLELDYEEVSEVEEFEDEQELPPSDEFVAAKEEWDAEQEAERLRDEALEAIATHEYEQAVMRDDFEVDFYSDRP